MMRRTARAPWPCVVVLLACTGASVAADCPPKSKTPPPVAAKFHKGDGWAIAAPGNWSGRST